MARGPVKEVECLVAVLQVIEHHIAHLVIHKSPSHWPLVPPATPATLASVMPSRATNSLLTARTLLPM
ncbi:hypothetical protein D8B24_14470 [Verminephrobacter aporrectodeae subsp. tuberculatae]|nr:hypothetical protein [Verminephrobacter aporrectodeae subsp. tuberculatae]